MDHVANVLRPACLLAALVLLLVAFWPGVRSVGSGIYATYGRSGLVSVTGDLLVYAVLFGIIAWAAVQLGVNLKDNYVRGRAVTLIAPVQTGTSDTGNAEGVKLAQILSANLSAIAVSAELSLPSEAEFKLFRDSQAFKQLPTGTDGAKDGLDIIFSITRIGNAPVVSSLSLDANTKFQVSGTDLTPYIAWLVNRFRRHNSLELTVLDLKPGRKLIWNLDTAQSNWESMTLDSTTTDAALEEFTWKYAHSLAAKSQNSATFRTLSSQQYRTIVHAYALYADAIRAAGTSPDQDMHLAFGRVLDLLETGTDPGPSPSNAQPSATPPAITAAGGTSGQSTPTNAPVKEVTAQWWELSKSFAVVASLARRQESARLYAKQALALLAKVDKKDRPNDAVIAALQVFASGVTTSKSIPSTEKTAVIFLTKEPLQAITPNDGVNDNDKDVRITTREKVPLFELKHRVTGPVSVLEAVQLSGLPDKARLVLDLPLQILNSPALPKLISESLNPSETVIYTRADAEAAQSLQQNYTGSTVNPAGKLSGQAIREHELER